MTMVIVLLIVLLTMAYFYLKCKLMTSLTTLMTIVLATVTAFSYYEAAAQLLIARGYGGGWAPAGSFLVVFVFSFALLRGLADYLVGSAIDLGKPAQAAASVVCGLLGGILISGNVLVAMGMMPVQHKLLYNRFPAGSSLVPSQPNAPALAVDGMVTGFYSMLSRGSLASKQSFAVVQSDFINKNHLNRYRLDKEVLTIASRKSLSLPRTKSPVRRFTVTDKGTYAVVRVGISTAGIVDGGAADENGRVLFFAGQVRLICKPDGQADNLLGKGQAVLLAGVFKNGELIEKRPEDMIDLEKEAVGNKLSVTWVDAAFKLPAGQVPVAFQFKQNTMLSLTGTRLTDTTPEIEQELDALLKAD